MTFLMRSELIARSEWLLILGAALISALLAPTVLGATTLGVFELLPSVGEVLRFFLITLALGGLLGGLAMHAALHVRSAWMLIGAACVGGFVFLVGTAVLHAAFEADGQVMIAAVLIFGIYGSFFSLPCGVLFGFVLLGMFIPSERHLNAPAQDSLAHVARIVARVLLLATALSLLTAWVVEMPYGSALSHMLLEVNGEHVAQESVAWTRLLFAAPLAVTSLLLWAYANVVEKQLHAARTAIGRHTHKAWSVSDAQPDDDDAMPLTEADRQPAKKRLLEPFEGGPSYRHAAYERVYVGLSEARARPQ